jgi:hypothetical protein
MFRRGILVLDRIKSRVSVCGLKTKRYFSLMDSQYRQYDSDTEVSSGWKNGAAVGLITGIAIGASVIGLIGLSVCPHV